MRSNFEHFIFVLWRINLYIADIQQTNKDGIRFGKYSEKRYVAELF